MVARKRPAAALDDAGDDGDCEVQAALPPIGKAAKAGEMPAASLEEFFQFLQCQLRMEARQVLEQEMEIKDPAARELWPHYEAFATPNLGGTERWVPYHCAVGVHEYFLIDSVHHSSHKIWNEKRRFQAIFIFRAHCKREFFSEAQWPHMQTTKFWDDPLGAFRIGGPLEKAMLEYRRKTRRPLLTLCFRMIPERLLKDDDENLVRSVLLRTQRLLKVAEVIWSIVKDDGKPAAQKFTEISAAVQSVEGLGETWAKMIAVCLDLAYPKVRLLESQCDVGVGAQAPLRCLLPENSKGTPQDPREALKQLAKAVNGSGGPSSKHFWTLLPKEEQLARKKFSKQSLFLAQFDTKKGKMSVVTLQVQLCEYRQFRNSLARTKHGLPLDESMKLPEKEKKLRPEELMQLDEKTQRLSFEIPGKDGAPAVSFHVSLQETNGNRRLAERVAMHCFEKLQEGVPKKAVEDFRGQLYAQCSATIGVHDVPADHCAWQCCRATTKHRNPLVSFSFQSESGGAKLPFQTTVTAAGGIMQAELVARLCYLQFEKGKSKDNVLALRSELYKKIASGEAVSMSSAKRRRTGGA